MHLAIIILAAGRGSRMMCKKPKVLNTIGGLPLLGHVFKSIESLDPDEIRVVVGHHAADVEQYITTYGTNIISVFQDKQLGTADALKCAEKSLEKFTGKILVLNGDVPFLKHKTLKKMLEGVRKGSDISMLGFYSENPESYGRILVNDKKEIIEIIEQKDATNDQKTIKLCNAGVYCGEKTTFFDLIKDIKNKNAAKEFYITDIAKIGVRRGLISTLVECDETEVQGINTQEHLSDAEDFFQRQLRKKFLADGVNIKSPATTYFHYDTSIGKNTTIYPNVVFGRSVEIASDVEILPFSYLEGCKISRNTTIGPFARIRPGTEIQENVKVGNFVEIKNSVLCNSSKASHLSYIGDARIGAHSNIGAGTVFCNYDGVSKHSTEIGEKTFIGSNTSLIAPVKVGDNVFIASGSTISKDVSNDALAIARQKQTNKNGLGKKIMDKLKKFNNK